MTVVPLPAPDVNPEDCPDAEDHIVMNEAGWPVLGPPNDRDRARWSYGKCRRCGVSAHIRNRGRS